MQLISKTELFFIVNALASIGLNIGVIGVNWFIIDVTKQNSVLGLYGAISLISAFFTLTFGNSITDRYNKITLLKYCCFGQSAIFLLTGVFYWINVPAIYIIYGLSIINMPFIVIFTTVSRGAIPSIWDKENLEKGNSALEITIQLGALLAAFFTGILYKYLGFSPLILTGAFFACSAGLLLSISKYSFEYSLPAKQHFWTELKEGFCYLISHKNIFIYGAIVFIPTIVISAANTVIPGYVEQGLHQGPILYCVADMCFAIGALLAGVLIARLNRYILAEKGSFFFSIISFSFLGILFFIPSSSWFIFSIFISGICLAGLRILLNTSFMKCVQEHFIGRVLSLLMALSIALQAVLCFYIGKIMDMLGPQFGLLPLLLLLMFCIYFLGKKINR